MLSFCFISCHIHFVYTDSEPVRGFWGADDEEVSEGGIPRVIVLGYDGLPIQPVALPSSDYIPGLEDPQTPPVPQDEDSVEPIITRSSRDDADGVDEDEEEEEHLAPADSAIVIPVDEPVFPPEGIELFIPPPSTDITIGARITVWPQASISLPPSRQIENFLAMTTPSPSPPDLTKQTTPSAGERLARGGGAPAPPTQFMHLYYHHLGVQPISRHTDSNTHRLFIDAVLLPHTITPPLPTSTTISIYNQPPVDRRDDIPESE
ncbi:hypothetical protein Tco_0707079 [Tanacetum coccineum]|uniref:Uncharacterized protein n=1 Tax=Tanacetum coccineum TaxID=301880 RepID=A0ABQ4YBD8_9ASTR